MQIQFANGEWRMTYSLRWAAMPDSNVTAHKPIQTTISLLLVRHVTNYRPTEECSAAGLFQIEIVMK